MLGTPYFHQCLDKGLMFPETRLRNLEGVTLTMRPLDPMDEVLDFVKSLTSIRGFRAAALRHSAGFFRTYKGTLEPLQLYASLISAALICTEFAASSPGRIQWGRPKQTYFGPTEVLDPCYTPARRVKSEYRHYFEPTLVTDADGDLHPDLADDLLCRTPAARTAAAGNAPPRDRQTAEGALVG